MIVVDTNIIVYFLISGDQTALAREARRRVPQWMAPTLWRYEFMNVLVTYIRNGGTPPTAAIETWRQAVGRLAIREQNAPPEQALLLAYENQISAYDAQYVALAINRNLPLISEDRALQRKFPSIVRSLQDFCT